MRSILTLAITAVLAAGCGSDSPGAATAGGAGDAVAELQATLDEHSPPGPAGKGRPSFAGWGGRLDALLTLEMAAQATALPAADAEKKYARGVHSLQYRWPSDRKKEVMGMSLPAFNLVGIGYLREDITEAFFRSRFTQPTDGQMQQLDAEAGRVAAERGLDQASAGMVKELAAALSKVHAIEEIDGVGDVAIWEQRDHDASLHLFVNGSSLELTVSVSDDPTVNRDATVALARQLVDRL